VLILLARLHAVAEADTFAPKYFLQMVLWWAEIGPRVINVDGYASYPAAIKQLKESGELSRRANAGPDGI
jgi:hypothetical protein